MSFLLSAAMEVGGSIIKKYEGDSAKLETFIDARWHRELKAVWVNIWRLTRDKLWDGDWDSLVSLSIVVAIIGLAFGQFLKWGTPKTIGFYTKMV